MRPGAPAAGTHQDHTPRSASDLLRARAAQQPDRAAFRTDSGRTLSFAAWDVGADAFAAGLRALGARPGDHVALWCHNDDWPDFAVGYLGVHRAGGVAVPMSTRLPARQVAHILRDCGAVGLAHSSYASPPQPPGWDGWTATLAQVDAADAHSVTQTGGAASSLGGGDRAEGQRPEPDDVAQILYTSGSTGEPKGVCATHRNLLAGVDPRARQRPLAHSEHFLHAFPIGHNIGQTMLMNALTAAPTALTMGSFAAERFCALIEQHRVGSVFLAPTMAVDVITSGEHRRHDLSSVVLLGSTGSALPPALAGELGNAFGRATVINYYTSTEAAPTQTTMVFDPGRPASVGRPTRPEDVLVGAPGVPATPGEHGDVWLRAASAPRWYHNDPAGSATVFRDGWTRMGDIGYLDADGYLHLVDRETDVIKSGGFTVSTLHVEAVLHEHPAVAHAAVLGVDHPSLGSAVAAALVLRDGLPAADAVRQIRGFARDQLAQPEQPIHYQVLDQLPRDQTGKVVKRVLAERFATADRPGEASPAGPAASPGDPAGTTPGATPARSATEARLTALWGEVFGGVEQMDDADPDFFAVGGDSLKAARLAARISDAFGVDAPATFAFDLPGLAAQAEAIDAQLACHAGYPPPEPDSSQAHDPPHGPAGPARSKGQQHGD